MRECCQALQLTTRMIPSWIASSFAMLIPRNDRQHGSLLAIKMIFLGSFFAFIIPALLFPSTALAQKNIAPDWFANEVSATFHDINGHPERQLHATTLRHYSHDKTTHIEQPAVSMTKAGQAPWHSKAEQGIAYHISGSEKIQRLELQGDVKLTRQANTNTPAMVMHTESLTIYPESGLAESAERVSIAQPGHQLHGNSMQASLKNETFQLTEKVHGQHQLQVNSDEATVIDADTLHYDHKLGHAVYQGDVAGLQGKRHLTADQLEVFRNHSKQIDQVKAFGNPATFKTTTDLGEVTGSAKQIHFHNPNNDVMLLDSSKLSRGKESYSAPKIEYNLATEVIKSPGSAAGGRTQVLIGRAAVASDKS